jgi:hypothetical protein
MKMEQTAKKRDAVEEMQWRYVACADAEYFMEIHRCRIFMLGQRVIFAT